MDWFVIWGTSLANHPKWLAVTLEERGAWITLLNLAHGFEPRWEFRDRKHAVRLLAREGAADPERLLEALVCVGFLDEREDTGRIVVHDHADWQPYPSDLPEARRERQRRSRARRASVTTGHDVVTPSHGSRRLEEIDIKEQKHQTGRTPPQLDSKRVLDRLLEAGLDADLAGHWTPAPPGSE